MSSPCDEGCGWGQTWAGYHKGFGTRATSSGLYLRLEAPDCSELLSPCHHLFSPWLMSPQASLGLHYPCVYCGNVRTSLCGERVSQIDGQRSNCDLADFHSYSYRQIYMLWGFCALWERIVRSLDTSCKKGEGLDDWFTSLGYITFHETSTPCLKMYVGAQK